jgi:hypothetical protein
MSKIKLELTRGTVISKGVHGVAGQIVEVDSDTARNLRQAGAAKLASDDAKLASDDAKVDTDDVDTDASATTKTTTKK